jgi:hypothetical protein
MKAIFVVALVALIAGPMGCAMSGMFEPHTYNWRTGMPSLTDQVTTFQQANKRWPRDHDDLSAFMKRTIKNFVPESYDRIDFIPKPDGNLEIDVYVFSTETTNRMALKAPHQP